MAKNKRRGGGYGFTVSLTGPGTIFTIGFITVAIGMGLLLARGVAPKNMYSDPGKTGELEVIPEPPDPEQKGLQLKTLKFKECASTLTIDLLVDKSDSMNRQTSSGVAKIARLKEAIRELISNAGDDSIIGIQSFTTGDITNDVPIAYYKDNKSTIQAKIAAIGGRSSTPTYEALTFSYNHLKESIPKFPADRKFTFIFISDGGPCPGFACPGNAGADQDPRIYSPNPADQIKGLGVEVYSLGIFAPDERQYVFQMETLLKSIASKPENYFAAESADDVKRLLTTITSRLCTGGPTPTPKI